MKQNLFGYKLVAFFVIVGALLVIGLIGEASEPRCIKTGCDNKQTRGSSYCYLHEPYTGSSTSHSSSSYSNKSYGSTSKSSTSSIITAINQILQTNHHIAVVLKRTQPPAGVHMTLMMMVMMISIWTAIMTMTDTTGIAIMRMV